MATFTGTPGIDNFAGANGVSDLFRFLPANLTSADTVSGGSGAANDILELLGPGALNSVHLSNVSGIEVIRMFAGTSIDLTPNMLATANGNILNIVGSNGNETIFGDDLNSSAHRLVYMARTGRDTFIGGIGNDRVQIGASEVTNQDIFSGGEGTDVLQISTAGAIAIRALANVTSFESIVLSSGGNSVTLHQATVGSTSSGVVTVTGSIGNDQVNAAPVTFGRVIFNAGAGDNLLFGNTSADVAHGGNGIDEFNGNDGNDTLNGGLGDNILFGGAGNDTLTNSFGNSTVIGSAGRDTITVTTSDANRADTLVYNSVADGTALGDIVRGDLGSVVDGDVEFAFNAAFNTLGSNFNVVAFDDGNNGAVANGADLVLYNTGQPGISLGSAAAVDAYFDLNYTVASGVGAFLAEFDLATGLVTVYYDPDAAAAGAVHVLAKIQGMSDLDHADLGDDFAFL